MDKNEFIEELKEINIEITEHQLKQLEQYYHLLTEWNKKINLTRIVEKKEVYLKHFYDSLTLSKSINLNKKQKLCDIGTGAGFPGMVLKIVFPELSVVLIDSLQKRIIFLEKVIQELGLKDIEVIHIRAEDYVKKHHGEFDIVTSRAVAKLNELLKYSLPLLRKGAYFIPMKANCKEEISDSKPLLKKLNAEIVEVMEFNLPNNGGFRTLISIKKH